MESGGRAAAKRLRLLHRQTGTYRVGRGATGELAGNFAAQRRKFDGSKPDS